MASITQKLIANEIDRALHRNGLPYDSPIRSELERCAEIGGGFQPEVIARSGNSVMTFDQQIRELREDPKFRHYFPPEPPRISRQDSESIRKNFTAIADGSIIVE